MHGDVAAFLRVAHRVVHQVEQQGRDQRAVAGGPDRLFGVLHAQIDTPAIGQQRKVFEHGARDLHQVHCLAGGGRGLGL